MTLEATEPQDSPVGAVLLRRWFDAAVSAADPGLHVSAHLPPEPRGRTVVVGAGKAAAAMAAAVEKVWRGPLSGLVITRYGHGLPCRRIEVVEAAHPVGDAVGEAATKRLLSLLEGLTADDLVLCLLSGGGSALLMQPVSSVGRTDKQAVVRALLGAGATIAEINCVRKHLSSIKGGRLAERAAPARLVTLAISDVPGDDPAIIASGPTVPDPSTRGEAAAVLQRYGVKAAPAVLAWLDSPESETPKPRSMVETDYRLIATPEGAIQAAAAQARSDGYQTLVLGSDLEGEARDVAAAHAVIVRDILRGDGPVVAPCVVLSGGETTVTVDGAGRGGRNGEFLLALAVELDGAPDVFALAADTDGIDGSEDNAGAWIGPDILALASRAGIDAREALARHDSYGVFKAVDRLVLTGPTRTNVNDFRAILVTAPASDQDRP